MATIAIYLELGRTSAFAVAVDWPGWCRRAKTGAEAIEALEAYRHRYALILAPGSGPGRGSFDLVASLPGDTTTDFGAPSTVGPWDETAMTLSARRRHLEILRRHWEYFDAAVLGAPEQLRKGPRGGGRSRDALAEHVREAERAYCSRAGVRVAPRTPWPDQRTQLLDALQGESPGAKWPTSYAIRRIAWHVADHAWELEDRSSPS